MTFTRQHYEAIAAILRNNVPVQGEAVDIAFADLVNDLADFFEADNPRFDRQRFHAAAVPNPADEVEQITELLKSDPWGSSRW